MIKSITITNLLTNYYSTFLRNTLAHYSGLPLITVRATNET